MSEAPRILVVDDDPDVTVYLSSLLEDNGYRVSQANSAAEALEGMANGSSPDVVIVDVLMPGRSGLDLLVTLRRDARWGKLPLVVMTGMDQILQDDCQTYLGQHREVRGPDAVIGKPIDPATLLRVVDRLATRPFDN